MALTWCQQRLIIRRLRIAVNLSEPLSFLLRVHFIEMKWVFEGGFFSELIKNVVDEQGGL
jgi:hypothetical protein